MEETRMDMNAPERPEEQPTRTLPPFQDLSEPASNPKRLCRSSDNKLFMGVCGGLADYFDLDPTLMRGIFATGTLLAGASILVYVVLIMIMPAEDQLDALPRAAAQSSIDEATAEIQRGLDTLVEKARSLTGRKSPPPSP